MIILVGGNGFIGRHVSCLAHQAGVDFAVVSRTGGTGFLNEFAPTGSAILAADFAGAAGDDLIRGATAIVYLVRSTAPASNTDEPWKELETDTGPAFRDFVRFATVNARARIIYCSSGGTVYGDQATDHPLDESAPLNPISPYGLGKVLCERILDFVSRTYGVNAEILRISNPVGIWQKTSGQGLIMAAFHSLHTESPLPIFGTGDNVRDYVDADDLARAVLAAADSGDHAGGTWNVGSGRGYSITDVVDLVSDVTGRSVAVEHKPSRAVDVNRIVLDISRFSSRFGWRPDTDLRASIAKIAAHFELDS